MSDPLAPLSYRPAEAGDTADIIALVGVCFALYPGCILDVDGEEPILKTFAQSFAEMGGGTRVTVDGTGRVIGMIAWEPLDTTTVELRKLYVHPDAQRRGIGQALTHWVLDQAKAFGATRIILWSDSRFTDAHRLYSRNGFQQGQETRDLNDLSNTTEYYFDRNIGSAEG